jgi:hypothetical protein
MNRKPKQLSLPVRLYRVSCDGYVDMEIQALTAGGAKFEVFRRAREAGYFSDRRTGFRDFLNRGWTAREVRR